MQHQHQDIMGRFIQIGDYIVFPKPGYGHKGGMAPLGLGEVIGMTKGGVKIKYLDETWNYKQRERCHYEETGEYHKDVNGNIQKDWRGNPYPIKEKVIDGYEDMEPVLVKQTTDRYFIVDKP